MAFGDGPSVKHVLGVLQGDFFNWDPPKNHKYGKKLNQN